MSDSEAKGKEIIDDHDPAEDEEFVPDDAGAGGDSGEAQEPDPEEVKEVLEDDEVDNQDPAEADEDQQAEVDEVYDSGGDYEEDVESEVSVEDDDDIDDKATQPRGKKRENEDEDQSAPNKKQKDSGGAGSAAEETPEINGAEAEGKVGSRHDDPRDPETQGSAGRLPEVGQQVEWKALPGFVDGEVVEILREGREVDGKTVRASGGDPRLVLRSNKSGKICVHKPEAVYF